MTSICFITIIQLKKNTYISSLLMPYIQFTVANVLFTFHFLMDFSHIQL